ncbi:MAG: LON peptidase substrate-binding domain-containing protein [Vicinamibacterales bacterium]
MLPTTLPIFPLPSVVLFPNVFLPLHVFEPRYRQMVADALAGDRMIGIVLLQEGFEEDYEGRPPVFDVGCAGLITHVERVPGGLFNIVLRGLEKFRIIGEEEPTSEVLYRRALVAPIAEPATPEETAALRSERRRLEAIVAPLLEGAEQHLPPAMPDEDLVNALAQYLELEPVERQALLERRDPLARCRSLIELLEMKALMEKRPGGTGLVH